MNLRGWIGRIDPAVNADEPITRPFLAVFGFFLLNALYVAVRYRYSPGQDTPYHALCIAIMSDRGHAGSLYTSLYEPLHPYEPNTIIYSIGLVLAKITGPVGALRVIMLYRALGLPLASLWALRRLGRSPWSSLLAFPLGYMQGWVGGFESFLFAAPTFILALSEFLYCLERPSRIRIGITMVLFAIVFLSHAQVWMWLGALSIGLTLAYVVKSGPSLRERGERVLVALGIALPSLLLFGFWYLATYAQGRVHGAATAKATIGTLFGAEWRGLGVKIHYGILEAFIVTKDPREYWDFIGWMLLLTFALVVGRLDGRKRRLTYEMCAIATAVSYFLLPDSVSEQYVAVRQFDMFAWLAPALIAPVRLQASRFWRIAVIGGIILFSWSRVSLVDRHIAAFNREMDGLEEVAAKTPLRSGAVAYMTTTMASPDFQWNPFYHAASWLGADRLLEVPVYDTTGESNRPVRYREKVGRPIIRMVAAPDWPSHDEIWNNYDLVLVRGWVSTPEQLTIANQHGRLVASSKEWQLWRRR